MPCFVLCDIQAKLIRGIDGGGEEVKRVNCPTGKKRKKIQLPPVKSSEQLYVLAVYVSLYSFMKHKVHNSIAFQEWVCLKPLCKLLSISFLSIWTLSLLILFPSSSSSSLYSLFS